MSLSTVVSNLSNYEWWLNNILSGIIPTIFILSISKIWKSFRLSLKILSRRQKLRNLTKIKTLRRDDLKIIIESQKNSARFIIFIIMAIFSITAIALNPVKEPSILFLMVNSMIMFPTIVAEIYWLNQDSFVKEIMLHREKLSQKSI